jgi:hypothetical protein
MRKEDSHAPFSDLVDVRRVGHRHDGDDSGGGQLAIRTLEANFCQGNAGGIAVMQGG